MSVISKRDSLLLQLKVYYKVRQLLITKFITKCDSFLLQSLLQSVVAVVSKCDSFFLQRLARFILEMDHPSGTNLGKEW